MNATLHRPPTLQEYGCVLCQKWHRQFIDPEYELHLMSQSKHGIRERLAKPGEVFALHMELVEPKPAR